MAKSNLVIRLLAFKYLLQHCKELIIRYNIALWWKSNWWSNKGKNSNYYFIIAFNLGKLINWLVFVRWFIKTSWRGRRWRWSRRIIILIKLIGF